MRDREGLSNEYLAARIKQVDKKLTEIVLELMQRVNALEKKYEEKV